MSTLKLQTSTQKNKAKIESDKLDLIMRIYHKMSYSKVYDFCKHNGLLPLKEVVQPVIEQKQNPIETILTDNCDIEIKRLTKSGRSSSKVSKKYKTTSDVDKSSILT